MVSSIYTDHSVQCHNLYIGHKRLFHVVHLGHKIMSPSVFIGHRVMGSGVSQSMLWVRGNMNFHAYNMRANHQN